VIAQPIQQHVTGSTIRGSNPGGGCDIPLPSRLALGPLTLLYNWYLLSFPWVKRPERDADHPLLYRVEVKERVELNLCSLSGSSLSVLE
jgi:hypothetical protein